MKHCLTSLAVLIGLLSTAVPADAAFLHARGKKPLKGRYIVMLKNTTTPGQVDAVAEALARQHGGRLLGTMKHAMRGFGIALPEAAALALSKHPFVMLVEEDEEMELARDPPAFSFEAARIQPMSHDSCPWSPPPGGPCPTGSFYRCIYSDDTFWNLDRLDNLGLINTTCRAYAYNSSGRDSNVQAGDQPVRAYVVDSGVYGAHVEFNGRVEAGANMMMDPDISDTTTRDDEEYPVNNNASAANNPCPALAGDYHIGHGTSVASVIGGSTTGVAKHVTIVPVKVMNCDRLIPKLAVARGLDWIQVDMEDADHDPSNGLQPRSNRAVVSMSIFVDLDFVDPITGYTEENQVCEDGLGGYTNCASSIEHEINEVITRNIPVVVSANNRSLGNCRTSRELPSIGV